MTTLIKGAKLIDKRSKYHNQEINVLIDKGKIAELGKGSYKAKNIIDAKGRLLSIGWCDMRAYAADPGFEHKEDLDSLGVTAASGGFTAVAVLPNNEPVTQTKNDVAYFIANSTPLVDFYPIAAVTNKAKGEELTEMIDLHTAGAVAFSDGLSPIWHTDILLKALQYLRKFDGLLIQRPEDIYLNQFGTMNEGPTSTALGMKGLPAISEELVIQRDLEILKYAGGKLHFANVSTAGGIKLIEKAKKQGLKASCDIAAHQLAYTDEDLMDFDTNLKVNPPFRRKEDNKALLKALKNGVVDVISSSHMPQDEDGKKLEFDLAEFGMTGLQTVGHYLSQLAHGVGWEQLIESVTTAPRELMGIEIPDIEKGREANLTLFDPAASWVLNSKTNTSKSRNHPLWEKQLTGKVMAVFKGKHTYLAD